MLVLKNQLKERSIKILQPQILIEVSDYARLFKKLGFFFFFLCACACVCVLRPCWDYVPAVSEIKI